MFTVILEIIQYRDLLMMLTLRDLRVRYKQAAMGFLWAVFMPIVAVCAGILIKKAMAVVAQKPLEIESIVSITVKVLPWTFFISSIRFSVQALVGKDGRVKDTRVVKSIPMLDTPAVMAVKQWVFKPALSNNKPVAVWVAVPVKFSLH